MLQLIAPKSRDNWRMRQLNGAESQNQFRGNRSAQSGQSSRSNQSMKCDEIRGNRCRNRQNFRQNLTNVNNKCHKISRIWRTNFKTTKSTIRQQVTARQLQRNKVENRSGRAIAAQWQPNNLLKSTGGEFPELVVSTETFLVTRSLYRNKQVVRAENSCDRRGPWQRVTDLKLEVKN